MLHEIKIYPVGNGDTCQIILGNQKRILIDYRHKAKTENGMGPEINLEATLKAELESVNRDYFDVVALTHCDNDHIENSTRFFHLEHAEKYQGAGRIKIKTLFVPAAMILETTSNDKQSEEFVIWRQEARHRLKQGRGIRVFSKPDKLKEWLENNGLSLAERRHLITDAGKIAPDFNLDTDGVEFFCHSPFVRHVDGSDILRNEASLIFNVRFRVNGRTYDYLAVGDSEWEVLDEIVSASKAHGNEDRLAWDIYNIPHHCSYLALSDEKGKTQTIPKAGAKTILQAGKQGGYIVSSSNPIPDTKTSYEQTQPPHIQARKCYEEYLERINGAKFLATMEYPNPENPEPLKFEITADGVRLVSNQAPRAAAVLISSPAPRAG